MPLNNLCEEDEEGWRGRSYALRVVLGGVPVGLEHHGAQGGLGGDGGACRRFQVGPDLEPTENKNSEWEPECRVVAG